MTNLIRCIKHTLLEKTYALIRKLFGKTATFPNLYWSSLQEFRSEIRLRFDFRWIISVLNDVKGVFFLDNNGILQTIRYAKLVPLKRSSAMPIRKFIL